MYNTYTSYIHTYPHTHTQQLWRHWLMAKMLPPADVQEACQLLGVHGEGVSMVFRLLGAKIGKRIYWPGSGFQGLIEYDLLTVEDDTVFGSRYARVYVHVFVCVCMYIYIYIYIQG